MKLVFDIECDALLDNVTKMHILVAHDIVGNKRYEFLEGDLGWQALFDKAELVIGHNVIGFDLAVLQKLFGYKYKGRVHDTLLFSQILNYMRFGHDGHSLKRWGEAFDFPKIEFDQWDHYSEEMRIYCNRDVDLGILVYEFLVDEYAGVVTPNLKRFISNEHKAAMWQQQAELSGWPVDEAEMIRVHTEIGVELQKITEALTPRLGHKLVFIDKAKGEIPAKSMRYTKDGLYNATDARHFGFDPMDVYFMDNPIAGPYCRVKVEPLKLSSSDDVKTFLYRNDWVPTEWNFKKLPDGSREKTSPKITEDSLEFLGGDGELYSRYTKIAARYGVLTGWLQALKGGRLHGDSMIIGTPSMRLRHSVIANIPTVDAVYGKEFRSFFTTLPGWTLVGCDSSGNQARGLAYYLGDAEFTNELVNGDIHQRNADLLTKIVRGMPDVPKDYVVPRGVAKRILYAFLFGASGGKMWAYIFGVSDSTKGNQLKEKFTAAVPGLSALMHRLNAMYTSTRRMGYGYITSIADNRIYVDSRHKLLVYLLQAAEKATCSAALALTMSALEAEGIPYIPNIFYHDEIDFMVPDQYAERAAEIGKKAFHDGPLLYGISFMAGEAKTGKNWLEIH